MKRFLYLTTALATLALSVPAAQAGVQIQGPALDGREVALPGGLRIVGAPPAEEVRRLALNGPALRGRRVEIPDGRVPGEATFGRVPELPRQE